MNRTVFLSDLTSHSYGSRTPSAPALVASRHLLMAQPPLLFKEGNPFSRACLSLSNWATRTGAAYGQTRCISFSGGGSPHCETNPSSGVQKCEPLFTFRRSLSAQCSCTRPHGSAQ